MYYCQENIFSRVSERRRDEEFDRTWIGKIKKINKKKCRKKKKECMDLKKKCYELYNLFP
jgi:hypothetical protein